MTTTCNRRSFLAAATTGAAVALAGCSSTTTDSDSDDSDSTAATGSTATPTGDLAIDMDAWNYDADNDVWWQVGCAYCTNPALEAYETMGLYVPGAYLTGEANDDGTYSCTLASDGAQGSFTASTAPIVIPVNTAGYAAQAAPTSYSYSSVSSYLEAGFIYAYPGCRGRDNTTSDDGSVAYAGASPWGVTDLKAAIRYLRYNDALLPGDKSAVFTFGHSGGGAQSSLVGATGDSELYLPYLEEIGAAIEDADGNELSDATMGAMCWCPITALDEADAAYEWMMGQYASSGTRAEGTFTAQLSTDLAAEFASKVNAMGLTRDGETLELEASDEGTYAAGSYYDVVLDAIEESLNNFLEDTEFPYTPSSSTMADGGFGGGLTDSSDGLPSGDVDVDLDSLDTDSLPSGSLPDGDVDLEDLDLEDIDVDSLPDSTTTTTDTVTGSTTLPTQTGTTYSAVATSGAILATAADDTTDEDVDLEDLDLEDLDTDSLPSGDLDTDVDATSSDSDSSSSTTYETASDYIDSLNGDDAWITYDESSNTATVSSVGAFALACKSPTKDVGAFDMLDLSAAENAVFGTGDEQAIHFDPTMASLLEANASTYAELENWSDDYPTDYADDLEKTDTLGTDLETRRNMYNPMYYALASSEGFGTSTLAPHWRIRTGIEQGDTSVTTELNLALALEAADAVEDVDFATVWGQGHTTAERTGDSDTNFIEWVESCLS